MQVGKEIAVLVTPCMDYGDDSMQVLVYVTNMIPLTMKIPSGWKAGECDLLLEKVKEVYELVRQRLEKENE